MPRMMKKHEARLRELHAKGLSDNQISKELGITQPTASRWRFLLALKPNFQKGTEHLIKSPPGRPKSITGRNGRDSDEIFCIFSEQESEFLRAINAWRVKHKRIPSLVEGFRIAKELGWQKQSTNSSMNSSTENG
jgi:hypothetical protein